MRQSDPHEKTGESLSEVLAVGQSELRSKQGLGKLVTDGNDHKDYAVVQEALQYAQFGAPDTRRSSIGHLIQGLYAACK